MKIKEVVRLIEQFAPISYQEDYDNSGLIVGDPNEQVKGCLICLDSTEEVVQEAIDKGCDLIIAHHPILFSGIKKLNGKNYIERTIIKAIKNNIAIYACHTNLDNVFNGVSFKMAEKIGLEECQVLAPQKNKLKKLITYCPVSHSDEVRMAMFAAGAGNIGSYSECSFNSEGKGTYKAEAGSTPYLGEIEQSHQESEIKIETIALAQNVDHVIAEMIKKHPYEEVAYDVYSLENSYDQIGSGVVGNLKKAEDVNTFLKRLKNDLKTDCIRYTQVPQSLKKIERVALCGGSGSFLLPNAKASGADVFITADFKYHQFFDAEDQIIIADVGHYESEQFTCELFYEILNEKIPNFAVRLSEINTNPINYL